MCGPFQKSSHLNIEYNEICATDANAWGGGKTYPTAKVLEKLFINEVVTTDSQQHKGMEDAERVLKYLRRMPKCSEETTAS